MRAEADLRCRFGCLRSVLVCGAPAAVLCQPVAGRRARSAASAVANAFAHGQWVSMRSVGFPAWLTSRPAMARSRVRTVRATTSWFSTRAFHDDSPALKAARMRRADLHQALLGVEHALAAPAPGRTGEWAAEVRRALVQRDQACLARSEPDAPQCRLLASIPCPSASALGGSSWSAGEGRHPHVGHDLEADVLVECPSVAPPAVEQVVDLSEGHTVRTCIPGASRARSPRPSTR